MKKTSTKKIDSKIVKNKSRQKSLRISPRKFRDIISNLPLRFIETFLASVKSSLKGITLMSLAERLNHIRKIVMNLVIIAFMLTFFVYVYQELKSKTIIIEPFEVPDELSRMGYNGRVLAQKLLDKINYIVRESNVSLAKNKFSTARNQSPLDLEISGGGISLRISSHAIKHLFGGYTKTFASEVILLEDTLKILKITTRVSGEPPDMPYIGKIVKLDSLWIEMTKYVYKHTEPYVLINYLLDKDKKDRDACKELIQYALKQGRKDAYRYHIAFGLVLIVEERYRDAIIQFETSHEKNPNYFPTYNGWGWALFGLKEFVQAKSMFEKAINIESKDVASYNGLGWVSYKLRKHDEAKVAFRTALEILDKEPTDSTDKALHFNGLGWILYKQEQFNNAIIKFRRASRLRPSYASAYTGWGWALKKQGKYDEAINKFENAIKIKPLPDMLAIRAQKKLEMPVLTLNIDPRYANAYVGKGMVLIDQEKYDSAISVFKNAEEKLEPYKDVNVYIGWGLALYRQKKDNEADKKFQTATTMDSRYVTLYSRWGWALYERESYQEAERKFKIALEIDITDADNHISYGWVLFQMQDYLGAKKIFEASIEIDSTRARFYYGLGRTMYQLGNYTLAQSNFLKAIEIDSTKANYHNDLGWAFVELDDYNQARKELEKAIRIDSSNAEYRYDLGTLFGIQGNNTQAATQFRKATEIDSSNADFQAELGWTLFKLGDNNGALRSFEEAVKQNVNHVGALYGLGRVEYRLGNYVEARIQFKKVIKIAHNSPEADSARIYNSKLIQ